MEEAGHGQPRSGLRAWFSAHGVEVVVNPIVLVFALELLPQLLRHVG